MAAMTAAEQSGRTDKPPRWRALGIRLLAGAGLMVGGWLWWSHRCYKNAMLEIDDQVAKGRYSAACRNLEALLEWKTDVSGGLHYLLGTCELGRGHIGAAEEAWASVVPGTEFSERAILSRMLLLRTEGRFARAEQLVRRSRQGSAKQSCIVDGRARADHDRSGPAR